MSVSADDLQRAVVAAQKRQSQGYFVRVKAGDQRAASLFARLVAVDLNPHGQSTDYGWLSKSPGEAQVDGFAEDAICLGSDETDLMNVVDLVNGAGAPGASIGGGVKPRRPNNHWVTPQALSSEDLAYLLNGGTPVPPPAPPVPVLPYPGDPVWDDVGMLLFSDYAQAGQSPNPQMGRWFGRTIWDATEGDESGHVLTVNESIAKHRKEWRAALGLPSL